MRLDKITVRYGDKTVIDGFSADFGSGGMCAVTGPSGCGKTTLLYVAAGFIKPDAGTVTDAGRISFMFQQPRLLPWLTALGNVCAVLDRRAKPRAEQMLKAVGITDFDKYPHELSGGMCQRVSLARALAYDSDILMLDEPFSAQDDSMRRQLLQLVKNDGRQVITVTHNGEDADYCDRVIQM